MTTLTHGTPTIAWCTCTESARTAHLFHSCDCLTLHIPWLKSWALSYLHPWPSSWCVLLDSTSPFFFYLFLLSVTVFLLLLSLFLPVLLRLLPPQRAVPWAPLHEGHGKPAPFHGQREWGHPERLHLSHKLWAQPPDLRRAQRLISSLLLHVPFHGPGRGWRDTRRDAHSGTPRTSRLLCVPGGMSVSQSLSSVMFDGSGKPDEHNSSNAQIRTLLEEQRQMIIAEYREKVSHHELHAAHAEEERRLLQGQLWRQKLEFREAHQQSLTEMEESRKFQSSTFDTIARRKLIEDQNTILESSGRVQELQNEVKCMNDSKRIFRMLNQFAVEIPTLPVDQCHSHLIRNLKGCWDILSYHRAAKKGRQAFGHTWSFGKRFWRSTCMFISSLSSMEFVNRRAAPFIHSGEKWKARTKSRSDMPIRTVSQRFSHLQWRRLFKELWGTPTTTADFGSSFRQVRHTSNVCLLEDKIQDWGMYLFAISYGSDAMDQRSGDGWFSGWIKIFVIYTGYFNAEFWSTWCEDCFSAEQNHP